MTLARCRAVGPDDDPLLEALADPIVIDAALTEGGWFARFVADRTPLLPEDEALLASSWPLVPRSVYEVVEVGPGEGLRARDLRTGDIVDVRERTFSREVLPESFVCARAVPDGQTHQFAGGMFPVAPGTEAAVLALCETEDPEALCEHVASLHRPPVLRTREGEPMVACTAALKVADARAAATVLDRHYRREGEMWVEMFPISEDEEIVRATLTMKGDRLEIQTHSEPRLDRVLARLDEVLPDARLLSDQRAPLAPGQMPQPPTLPGPAPTPGPEAEAELQDFLEQRWLDESVPALAGLTPRQAAADPTRRDELRRLIASFPADDAVPEGAATMRPARLRELLDQGGGPARGPPSSLLPPADACALEHSRLDTGGPPRVIADALAPAVGPRSLDERGLQRLDVDGALAGGRQLGLQVHALLGQVQPAEGIGDGEALVDGHQSPLDPLRCALASPARLVRLHRLQVATHGPALITADGEGLLVRVGHRSGCGLGRRCGLPLCHSGSLFFRRGGLVASRNYQPPLPALAMVRPPLIAVETGIARHPHYVNSPPRPVPDPAARHRRHPRRRRQRAAVIDTAGAGSPATTAAPHRRPLSEPTDMSPGCEYFDGAIRPTPTVSTVSSSACPGLGSLPLKAGTARGERKGWSVAPLGFATPSPAADPCPPPSVAVLGHR